ncbi:MAG TPA: aldo/keto reductase [Phycisphaerae bacterium]|nr:aldo/keto reductase [Phycisphaerae bacterium]HRY68352.1 aldo/keto reductase [Phycisphaerae bacterium]HSA26765.1 aldo/keto reductase [Phycisphaerae bacterium]
MQYRPLGKRGPMVSTVGFGTWAIGGRDWGKTDDEVSRRAIHEALDRGVTLLDTADVYGHGHSEELIGGVLRERGESKVIIATKAGNDFYHATPADDKGYGPLRQVYDRQYLIEAVEKSLKRLRVETLDILQLHSPDTAHLERDDPWDALQTLKRQGKIRWAGWSVQSFQEILQARFLDHHHDLLDVLQVRYNLLEREAEKVLFPKAAEYGTGIIVRIPILFGLLSGKFTRQSVFGADDHRRFNLSPQKLDDYLARLDGVRPLFDRFPGQSMAQVSLRFCLTHPVCHTVIPGGKTPEQVRENCAASDLGPIDPGDLPH